MAEEEPLRVVLLRPGATVPRRATDGSVGYDLCLCLSEDDEDDIGAVVLPASERLLVGTGVAIRLPSGTYGRIAPRSGLAVGRGLGVGAGVVDPDYTGEVKVLLINHDAHDGIRLADGARIAQLIVEVARTPPVVVVGSVAELGVTDRGGGGFGSTGA